MVRLKDNCASMGARILHYFNSSMVRLKASSAQYLRPPSWYFNSSMVRLKAGSTFLGTLSGLGFQFQYGAIKSG